MIIQNSTGQLMIIYSVISFLLASSLSAFESKLSKFLGALVFMLSIWCFFDYLRIDHEFFGFNSWGIAASVSALLAFYFALTNSSDKLIGPKLFMIPAYLFLAFMICVPNINRAAENNYQKVTKEWEVFHALQKQDPYTAKGKEPKEKLRELSEFKESEKQIYISKEQDKLIYAVTESGGLIVLSFCFALLATLCAGRKPPIVEDYV